MTRFSENYPEDKLLKPCAFSEEDMFVVSKHDTTCVWTGSKIMESGASEGTPQQASGFNFASGETDVETINWLSGTGRIRIPEIGQLHKLFVFPRDPRWIASVGYYSLTLGATSGLPSGDGGCSGKMALLRWRNICSNTYTSGMKNSGYYTFDSGIVDVIAFGSIY